MGTLKETVENLVYVLNKIKIAMEWASTSFVKRIIFLVLLIILILTIQYTYLNYLLTETRKSAELRSHDLWNRWT